MNYENIGDLKISKVLAEFVRDELLEKDVTINEKEFWLNFSNLVNEFSPRIKECLNQRDEIQHKLDGWYKTHLADGQINFDQKLYQDFLTEIGYLEDLPASVKVSTTNVDEEFTRVYGPQLVVPASNARFALNAANARWGSIYDALYGSDVIDPVENNTGEYNKQRGDKIVKYVASLLDKWFPLSQGSHGDVQQYFTDNGTLFAKNSDETDAILENPERFLGFQGRRASPTSIFLVHNGLRVELRINKDHTIGKQHPAGLMDVKLESALTTIIDFEDSVADVDAADKVNTYRNWLGLMKADLTAEFDKNGTKTERNLARDKHITGHDYKTITLAGRSIMMVRNVGHHMFTDAVLDCDGNEVPEGLLDALVSVTAAGYDLLKLYKQDPLNELLLYNNSRVGSVYIVKPKMHGSKEVKLTCDIMSAVEKCLNLNPNTIKIGIMDEERRTSVNLRACINAASNRVVFINTGFLDRTGDEIHSSMAAGAVAKKADMQKSAWLTAYEKHNVSEGIFCGLISRGQIGKGMWARPDDLKLMLETKEVQLRAGASTAWMPSPTAATLHALHYHNVNILENQIKIGKNEPTSRLDLLNIPLIDKSGLSADEIKAELENNVQSILGYVVRWVDQGVGCSKVLDTNNVALMEDRATLRISSQLIANWLFHGVVSKDEVMAALSKMAKVVDEQNKGDNNYIQMSGNEDSSIAFAAATDLILKGAEQPNGYTEFILNAKRREVKSK